MANIERLTVVMTWEVNAAKAQDLMQRFPDAADARDAISFAVVEAVGDRLQHIEVIDGCVVAKVSTVSTQEKDLESQGE